MRSKLAFDLENTAEIAVILTLIPASLRRLGLLKGMFLKGSKFKDDTDEIDITVSAVLPEGGVDELNEYTSQMDGIKVFDIGVTTKNMDQSTQGFMEKTFVDFKQPVIKVLDTTLSVNVGKSTLIHTFLSPFVSAPMKSLEMRLLPGEKVRVEMTLEIPQKGSTDAQEQVILPQQ